MENPSKGQEDREEFNRKAYHSAAAQWSRAHSQAGSPGPAQRPSHARKQILSCLRLQEAEKRHWGKAAINKPISSLPLWEMLFFFSPESLIEFSLLLSSAVQEEVQPHACMVIVKKIHK